MNACDAHGIDILATSFDGECYSLIVEDSNEKPLTLLQLQSHVFEKSKKLSKNEIIQAIVSKAKKAMKDEDIAEKNIEFLKTGKIVVDGPPLVKYLNEDLRRAIAERGKTKKVTADAARTKQGTKKKSDKATMSRKRKVQQKTFNPQPVTFISRKILESGNYYKSALNLSYSKLIWPNELERWKENSPITHGMNGFFATWFCIPEYCSKRKKLEHKIWDSTHLMTNLRRVVCSSGTAKLKKEAWLVASKDQSNKLKTSMVTDLPDKQDIGFALTTFSAEVEQSMAAAGYEEEAKFCRLLRNWWIAEDEPGIPAMDRVQYRIELKDYLLEHVDFGSFPPFTSYVKGEFELYAGQI